MGTISDKQYAQLKRKGYTGTDNIEDIVSTITNKLVIKKDEKGFSWWIQFKNRQLKEGINFYDLMVSELERVLK